MSSGCTFAWRFSTVFGLSVSRWKVEAPVAWQMVTLSS